MALARYWYCSPQAFKQHEHYTFYGFVMAMPNFGAETGIVSLYQPRFLPALPQLLLNQFLRLPAFTCDFGITTQRYNSEFHSCLLNSSINSRGAVWYKMWRRKGVQVNEHLPSLTLWSQLLPQFSYLEFVTGRGGEQGPGGPITNAIHYHRLIVLFVLNPSYLRYFT